MSENKPTGFAPSFTWGSSAALTLGDTAAQANSAQLAQVSLPEPAVCSIYFQATMRTATPATARIGAFTLNLLQGVGRVTVPRQISFASQPSPSSPLEFTLPFVPLHALQVDITAAGIFTAPGTIDIQVYMILSPITRLDQKSQEINFGMALPGEADSMDDELRDELEAEGPTAEATVLHDHGEAHEDDEPEEPEVETAPPWVMAMIKQLEARLGRPPTLPELRRAVQRRQARNARRRRVR